MLKLLKKYRYPLMLTLCLTALSGFISEEKSSLYWYYNGQELRWEAQPDVFVFRLKDHSAYTEALDADVVEAAEYRGDSPDKLNILFFNAGASASQRNAVINQVKGEAKFEAEFPAITKVPAAPYTENLWYFATDKIIVQFKSDSIAKASVNGFSDRYGLTQTNDVSNLPAGGIYAYIFQFEPGSGYHNGLDLTQAIYLRDSSFLQSVEPSLVKIYRQPVNNTVSTGSGTYEDFEQEFYVVNDREQTLQVYFKIKPQQLYFCAYDLFGRQLMSQPVQEGERQLTLDISTFSSGIYFATMEDSNGQPVFVRKFRKF